MDLIHLALAGEPMRWFAEEGTMVSTLGVVGIDVAAAVFEGEERTVVQVLFDDEVEDFDPMLLDCPLMAELTDAEGAVGAREPLDHDRFRRQLLAEREEGTSVTRGVLVLTDGELPPPWVRLAFLPLPIEATSGTRLMVRRTTVAELAESVEGAHAAGALSDAERLAMLTSLEQLHPDDSG